MISVILYIYFLVLSFITIVVLIVLRTLLFPFKCADRVVHSTLCFACRFFFGGSLWWPIEIIGKENIDKSKSRVYVYNHQAMMDIPTFHMLRICSRSVAKKEVYYIPIFGTMIYLRGAITIKRENAKVAMERVIRDGKKTLERGESVNVFPEGTRSKDGEIHRFKAGAFALAKSAGVEIVPVVMDGTKFAFKKNYLINWRNKTTIKVLPPISREIVESTDVKELAMLVQDKMTKALDSIRKGNL